MSELEQKAVEILDKLEAITVNYAPDVADAALAAVQVSAVSEITARATFAAIVAICWFILLGFRKRVIGKINEGERGLEEHLFFWTAAAGSLLFVLSVMALFELSDVWTWVSLFNPELGLAHKVTGL
ncbi:MAG: hypothetical protein AAF434_17310 [Pseudomonadota bacterium]